MIRLDDTGLAPLVAVLLVAGAIGAAATQRTHDPCARPEALFDTAGIAGSSPGVESSKKPRSVFQRTEGDVLGTPLHYVVVRAMWASKILRGPESYVNELMVGDASDFAWHDAGGVRLPVHFVANQQEDRVMLAGYVLVFDGRPVERLLPSVLTSAWRQLVRGREPTTVLLAWGALHPSDVDAQREAIAAWLADAWRFYANVCAP